MNPVLQRLLAKAGSVEDANTWSQREACLSASVTGDLPSLAVPLAQAELERWWNEHQQAEYMIRDLATFDHAAAVRGARVCAGWAWLNFWQAPADDNRPMNLLNISAAWERGELSALDAVEAFRVLGLSLWNPADSGTKVHVVTSARHAVHSITEPGYAMYAAYEAACAKTTRLRNSCAWTDIVAELAAVVRQSVPCPRFETAWYANLSTAASHAS